MNRIGCRILAAGHPAMKIAIVTAFILVLVFALLVMYDLRF